MQHHMAGLWDEMRETEGPGDGRTETELVDMIAEIYMRRLLSNELVQYYKHYY